MISAPGSFQFIIPLKLVLESFPEIAYDLDDFAERILISTWAKTMTRDPNRPVSWEQWGVAGKEVNVLRHSREVSRDIRSDAIAGTAGCGAKHNIAGKLLSGSDDPGEILRKSV